MAVILNLSSRTGLTASPHGTGSARVTPTPLPVGTVVYTSPPSQGGFESFSWPPDSKRVAVLTSNQSIQIWDATTGAHRVTVTLPGPGEWTWAIQWSPNEQEIALATNKHILIVDGQSGSIIHSDTPGQASASVNSSSGISYLSSRFPASGGFGYRSTAWSPDGKLIASGLSFGPNGNIQVWNPATGAVAYTLSLAGPYVASSVTWSSDGKYLAAHMYNTQGITAGDKVIVWNAATHRTVFQHTDSMPGSDSPILWQPESHNLAFTGIVTSGSNQVLALELWDTAANRLVKKLIRQRQRCAGLVP
jgi:WD40 repeat protein